ncbi:MAG TPA: hypothetical protein PKZ99_03195 [Azospirillaceae bacterium]|nr:hypothetical protein [Azospirillaceae bacterium]
MSTARALEAIKSRLLAHPLAARGMARFAWEGGDRPPNNAPWLLATVEFGLEVVTIGKINGRRRRTRPGVLQIFTCAPKRDGVVAALPAAEQAKIMFDFACLTTVEPEERLRFDAASVLTDPPIKDLKDAYAAALTTATFEFTYFS